MSVPSGPNPITTSWAIWRARRVRPPAPTGEGAVDHDALQPVLSDLRRHDVSVLADRRSDLAAYRDVMATVDPDSLSPNQALAFWLNVYNAGALDLAARAATRNDDSVLRVPGAFEEPWIDVGQETLTLTEIEHGKIRRFHDPRVHGALICGSASCPTLRHETFDGARLDHELDDQMRAFLAGGGAVTDRVADRISLSRVFLWYGGDFARPEKMPTWFPPRRKRLVSQLTAWLDPQDVRWVLESQPKVTFQPYDWSLACSVE